MNPADGEAAKLAATEGQSPGAVAASDDQFEEQLRATLKDVQRTNHQSKPVEYLHGSDDKFDEELRVSVDALLHPSPSLKPELDDLLSTISHHLDDEASERKRIYNRLLAIQSEMERPAFRGFTRYLVASFIGIAVILAWLSYGEATKQIISTRAPELGWSPEVKQMIAGWLQHLALKPPVVESKTAPVTQTAPEMVAPKAPAAPSLNPQQVQQIETDIAAVRQAVERHLADVRETVEQLAASQNQMAREIEKLQAANQEILAKIPTPPPQPPAAPARKNLCIRRRSWRPRRSGGAQRLTHKGRSRILEVDIR
jgi:pyruvate/2-oxoglutarate dehydrogenase complex dihydrolipoamide acyltransferase (E2) component